MFDYLIFILYKIFKFIVLLLPKFFVKFFLDIFASFIYVINIKHKKIAKANLDFVYEDRITENEKFNIIKSNYKNLVYNIYEFVENQTLTLKDFEKKVTVKNEKYILDAIKNKRKIILITAHYGNWEYGSTFIPLKYAATTMVGRPLNNNYLNKELKIARTRNNNEMLTKREASRGLVKALKNDRILGFVIDQHNRGGIDIDFLGHKVKQADSASRLAVKFDAVVIPVFFTMSEFGKYTAEFYEPLEAKDFEGENQILDFTQAQAKAMEKHILNKPGQWLWLHKRFKKYNKNIYKKNV
jgi:KDO2-lipid IV(A) lauroyltransferase